MLIADIDVLNAVVGWALVALGALAIIGALVASLLEAFRKALGLQEGVVATGIQWPWKDIVEAVRDVLKELMGKTGGPPFFMGLILIALGVLVISKQPL